MDGVERRLVSFESTKKGPQFQRSQDFWVTKEVRRLRWLTIPIMEFRTSLLCSNFPTLHAQRACGMEFQRVTGVAKYVCFSSGKLNLLAASQTTPSSVLHLLPPLNNSLAQPFHLYAAQSSNHLRGWSLLYHHHLSTSPMSITLLYSWHHSHLSRPGTPFCSLSETYSLLGLLEKEVHNIDTHIYYLCFMPQTIYLISGIYEATDLQN